MIGLTFLRKLFSNPHKERFHIIMGKLEDVTSALSGLTVAVSAAHTKIIAELQAQGATILQLKAQVDAGSPVSSTDLDNLVLSINSITASIQSIDLVPPTDAPAAGGSAVVAGSAGEDATGGAAAEGNAAGGVAGETAVGDAAAEGQAGTTT